MNKKAFGYRIHALFSIGLFFIFLALNKVFNFFIFSLADKIILLMVALFYGLLPDIDTTESKLGKLFLVMGLFFIILCFIFDKKILGIIIVLLLYFLVFIKHRGFIHTVVSSVVLSAPLYLVGSEFAIMGFLAYLGHLIADRKIKII